MATHPEPGNAPHHPQQDQRKPRPQPEQSPKCPRCDSTNTKFCYYNNYSLSQPRYFCKSCRRYWTKGGSLRNVPVGGGCRKNHRRNPNPSSSGKLQNSKQDQELSIPALPPLAFDPNELPFSMLASPNPNPSPDVAGFLDVLRNGINSGGQFREYCGDPSGISTGLMMLPNLDGGLIGTETAVTVVTAAGESFDDDVGCENSMWDRGHHHHHYHHGNLGVEWSGMQQGASSWHGIINSSLM